MPARGALPTNPPQKRGSVPLHAVRPTGWVEDAVFFGPWIGEFGHGLMWAAMCRLQAMRYKRVIVCARPGEKALFDDFATEFLAHNFRCEGMCAGATRQTHPPDAALQSLCPTGVRRVGPSMYMVNTPARFFRYGKKRPEYAGAIVVHARSRGHVRMRNWSADNWNRLARWLLDRGKVRRLVCIGTPDAALPVEGALDKRAAPLQEQMDILASARGCIGPSSGPMHLAQHCGCPVLVWCGGGPHERAETQGRYIQGWNPFGILAHAYRYASWQPPYHTVLSWTGKFLESLHAS